MSYFPEDIPFMSKEELRENGIRIPKDAADTNVGDTISRQAAIDAVNDAFDRETLLTGFVRSIAVRAIRDMPSVQSERAEGEWVLKNHLWECNKCGCRINVKNPLCENDWNYYFCPHCGTKMIIAVQRF